MRAQSYIALQLPCAARALIARQRAAVALHKLHFSVTGLAHLQLGDTRPVYEDKVNIVNAEALQDLVACKLRLDSPLLQCTHCVSDENHIPCSKLLIAADVEMAAEGSQDMLWGSGRSNDEDAPGWGQSCL